MNSETASFQKKIKDYVISYCPTEYYGKNIHGEIRAGYRVKENKIVVFRIVPLPLTPALSLFLQLQQHYSGLNGFARVVHGPLHSSSNHYVPLEYFPKTFRSQSALFKSNPKYFDQFIQKFLRVYAFFYNMRVSHGNLTADNIGITFQGKVKLMDFGLPNQQETFQKRAQQDFYDFKNIIGIILQKEDHFAAKFSSFNSQKTHNWEHLFSLWHVTSPLEPVYLSRKGYIDNIVTLLHKLYSSLEDSHISQSLLISVRLLMLNYLRSGKPEDYKIECEALESITGKLQKWDCQKLNSLLMGAVKDPEYYGLSPQQRLVLVCCLVPSLNHEYIYYEIVSEFNSEEKKRNQLLGNSIYLTYRYDIFSNLLRTK